MSSPEDGTIAAHDNGEVGINLRQVGFEFQIEQHYLGYLFDQWAETLRFAGNVRPFAQSKHDDTGASGGHGMA
jgi:hypothetical protein